MTQSRGIRKKKFNKVTLTELALFRSDARREKTLNITAYIVCRDCGSRLQYLSNNHRCIRERGVRGGMLSYREAWPEAPLYAVLWLKEHNRMGKRWRKNHPEKAKDISRRYSKNNRERIRKRRRELRESNLTERRNKDRLYKRKRFKSPNLRNERRAADRRRYLKKITRATEAELAAFLRDPAALNYVVCLEADVQHPSRPCHAKLQDLRSGHLPVVHDITTDEYSERHPGAPTRSPSKLTIARPPKRKPGRRSETEAASIIQSLYTQTPRPDWKDITAEVNRRTGIYRSVDACQNLRKRHFGRPTN